ncbi:hypothetical protein SK128_010369, partial [Halocaridina rubra]
QSFGLRIYLQVDKERYFRPIYLEHLTLEHFVHKIEQLLEVPSHSIEKIALQHVSGMPILFTEEVIRNLRDETTFSLEVEREKAEKTKRVEDPEGEEGEEEEKEEEEEEDSGRAFQMERNTYPEERDRTRILVK